MHTRMGSSASSWPLAFHRPVLTLVRPDGQLVHIIALLITPLKHQKQHMALLAALSQRLQQEEVRQRLLQAADAAEIVDIFTGDSPPG